MKKLLIFLALVILGIVWGARYFRGSHLAWRDVVPIGARPAPIGLLPGNPLERLGLTEADLAPALADETVRYEGLTRYLNNARAVVTHTVDDTTKYMIDCLDALDKYDVKATVFISTERPGMARLWPRLRQAAATGHEIGSHSRRHQCQWPDTALFCFKAYTDYEIQGSRNDILAHVDQPYVWSWCYPCGNCAEFSFVHRKLARAGYLVARNYPGEAQGGHLVPDLQTYAANPYSAAYTQVAQKKGGIAPAGRTDVAELNAKFDEVYEGQGIYHFLSHPAWLDYGAGSFYEQHLAHLARRSDVWYVPMGPLYAYRTVVEKTQVRRLAARAGSARFVVYYPLDPRIFTNSVTLEFSAPEALRMEVRAHGRPLVERSRGLTDRWDAEYFRRQGRSLFVTVRPNTILEMRWL